MGMAQNIDCDATGEIDILSAGLIPDVLASATHRNDFAGCIVGHHNIVELVARNRGHLCRLLSSEGCSRVQTDLTEPLF